MDTDFLKWMDRQQGRQYELHSRHVNPVFVKMLRTIGFDKGYVRGEGSYLYDGEGNRYLDLLTGWGVFALGRNHPKVRSILEQVMSREMPNLVRNYCREVRRRLDDGAGRPRFDGLHCGGAGLRRGALDIRTADLGAGIEVSDGGAEPDRLSRLRARCAFV